MNGGTTSHPGAPERIRVLIADDSAVFRSAVERFLRRLPQVEVVGAAEDADHALKLAASTRPDLVLMDVQMPRLNGLQALRQIRAQFPEMCVIMVTLYDSEQLRASSAASGAHAFIPKNCLREQLPGAISAFFASRVRGGEEERA